MPVLRFEASLGFFAWLTDDERRLAQLPEAILSVVISCQASSHVTAWGNSLGSRFLPSVVFPPRAVFSRSNASIFLSKFDKCHLFFTNFQSELSENSENCLRLLLETTLGWKRLPRELPHAVTRDDAHRLLTEGKTPVAPRAEAPQIYMNVLYLRTKF